MKTYTVCIENKMFGYQNKRFVKIEALTEKDALMIAQRIDIYADVSIKEKKDER
jgi:hypothetical protein